VPRSLPPLGLNPGLGYSIALTPQALALALPAFLPQLFAFALFAPFLPQLLAFAPFLPALIITVTVVVAEAGWANAKFFCTAGTGSDQDG
jgi:hypothetical protein